MEKLKDGNKCGEVIRTAYGFKETNQVNYVERAELLTEVSSALSIRGKNPKEFRTKLEQLIKEYE